MKALVRHLWSQYQEAIAANSLLNCHVEGLHSVMLQNTPGQRIRLFVTENADCLASNDPFAFTPLSIGFHPHHCGITLHGQLGVLLNYVAGDFVTHPERDVIEYDRFRYDSKITGSGTGFRFEAKGNLNVCLKPNVLYPGESVQMEARWLHTVCSLKNSGPLAWFVFEGIDDPDYKPLCWSNIDLAEFDSSKLYVKTNKATVERLLCLAGLL